MIIEVNKDIERYKETVVIGLTAKQLIFSVASVVVGGGIVLSLYRYIGLTISVYVAIPAVVPIALGGFYSFNGMSFYEMMRRKLQMAFANHPLTFVSTEGEGAIRQYRMEEETKDKADKKKKKGKEASVTSKGKKEEFEAMKKKTKKMFIGILAVMVLAIIGMVICKAKR